MKTSDVLINMLARDPDLYKILNSSLHLNVLEEIFIKPRLITDLTKNTSFKKVSILYNILDTLIDKEFIKKIIFKDKETYYITDKGNEFIKNYKLSKKELNLI